MADLPTFEATIRSPLGEVRVWIDADGELRTEMRIAFPSGPDTAEQARLGAAVAEQAAVISRGIAGRTGSGMASPNAFVGWFTERLTPDTGGRVSALALYEDYLAWCARRGLAPMSHRHFGDALTQRGVLGAGKDRFGRKLRGGVKLSLDGESPPLASDDTPAPPPPLRAVSVV